MTVQFDVVYATHDDRELHVDIYTPSGSADHHTAVLVYHGGLWTMGDRKLMQQRCEALAARGFTALAVEYRLIPEAPWPAQLRDVKAAIRWTSDQAANLGIDADRIVLQGHSAGAHLALIAAGTVGRPELDSDAASGPLPRPVAAVVAYYPPVELGAALPMPDMSAGPTPQALAALCQPDGSTPAASLLGEKTTVEAAAAASPLAYVNAQFPPTILFHGTSDTVIAAAGSVRFFDALRAVAVQSELHLVADVVHEFDLTPPLGEVCVAAVNSFLQRQVVDPAGFLETEGATNPLAALSRIVSA
jgi:acetyl esterase/lipase